MIALGRVVRASQTSHHNCAFIFGFHIEPREDVIRTIPNPREDGAINDCAQVPAVAISKRLYHTENIIVATTP